MEELLELLHYLLYIKIQIQVVNCTHSDESVIYFKSLINLTLTFEVAIK